MTQVQTRPTVAQVMDAARLFGGAVHGEDAAGIVDLEWPAGRLAEAVNFAKTTRRHGWRVEIRPGSPIVTFGQSVCLQVHAEPADHGEPVIEDPAHPRNCPGCGTVEWWQQSGSVSAVDARRQEWHDAGHPAPFEGWKARERSALPRNRARRVARCGWCEQTGSLTSSGLLATHSADGLPCPGSGLTPEEAAARPVPTREKSIAEEWGF